MKNRILTATVLVALIATGCASNKKQQAFIPAAADAVVQVIPPQGRPIKPSVVETTDAVQPIYHNPVIEEVEMAAYVNDDGNLVLPSKQLVIRTPGGWNLDAARKGEQYYVPADNQPPHLVAPSEDYYDFVQSKFNGKHTPTLDVSSTRVTGFTQKEDKDKATATLRPGETLAFDQFLGWLAVPSKTLGLEQIPDEESTPVVPAKSHPTPVDITTGTSPTPSQTVIISAAPQVPPAVAPAQATPAPETQQSRDDKMKKILAEAFDKAQSQPIPQPAPASKQ